jgi:hypothetical protein
MNDLPTEPRRDQLKKEKLPGSSMGETANVAARPSRLRRCPRSSPAAATLLGGLASYGPKLRLLSHGWSLIGRVLKGEKPADLPVQQSTRIELVVDMKTGEGAGHYVPAHTARPRQTTSHERLCR